MDSIFNKVVITKRFELPVSHITSNIKETIERKFLKKQEGICIKEGYVKKKSINIISFSGGILRETSVIYDVTYECDICYPCVDQLLECKVENTTKAGLKASIQGDDNPLIIFVPRDLHLENEHFSNINVDEKIIVKIIGVRFELNDKQVAVIAELTGDKK